MSEIPQEYNALRVKMADIIGPARSGGEGPRLVGFYPFNDLGYRIMGSKSLQKRQAEKFVSHYASGENFQDSCVQSGFIPSLQCGEAYYVYALVRDDEGRVVYIGKGKGKRMHSHSKEVESGRISGYKKYRGLKTLSDAEISVTPYVIFGGMSESKALYIEKYLISELRSTGLLNTSSGSVTSNESAIEKCQLLLDRCRNIRQVRKPLEVLLGREKAMEVRDFLIIAIENQIKQIKVTAATGYTHTSAWDRERGRKHFAYLKEHPELEPVKVSVPDLMSGSRGLK